MGGALASAMLPGRVDKKYIALLGLGDRTTGNKFMLPVGTFLLSSSNGDNQKGKITQGGHCYDIVREFNFTVNDDFPHTLYGQQDPGINPRYDPAYNLVDQGDHRTFQCDAVAFMTQPSDNVFFSSDFQSLFAYVGNNNGVNVYSSQYNGGKKGQEGLVPIPPNDPEWGYSWAPETGTVFFNKAHGPGLIVSLDGKPQGMSPENMLTHLFVDYAGYDPNYLSWLDPSNPDPQLSNVVLPVYVGGRDKTIWQIAQDIANMTAPRMVAYLCRIDELGFIQFYESKTTASPSETLYDFRDIIDMSYTWTDENMANVIRGDARSNDNQPITSLAYDLQSIIDNGQRSPYVVPDELLLSTRGMNSYASLSFMNMMTGSILFTMSEPILQLTVDVLPNPMRIPGNKINIVQTQTGKFSVYVIKGISDTIIGGAKYKQQLRLQKARLYNNFAMGMPSALTNDQSQQQVDSNAAAIAGQTGLISKILIGGTQVFSGGQQVLDDNGDPVLAIVTGSSWDFEYGIEKSQAFDSYVWRFWYLEGQNSLSSTDLMVVREQNWVNNDGVKIGHSAIASGYSDTTSHTSGVNQGNGTAYLRSNIIVAPAQQFLNQGYPADLTSITFNSNTQLATAKTGLGLGDGYTGSFAYFPASKYNYGYFCILIVNVAGAIQSIMMPFILRL